MYCNINQWVVVPAMSFAWQSFFSILRDAFFGWIRLFCSLFCVFNNISKLLRQKFSLTYVVFNYLYKKYLPIILIILQPRAELIATFALCGFTNPGSVGIVIGAVSAIAPNTRETLSNVSKNEIHRKFKNCYRLIRIKTLIEHRISFAWN